MDFQLIVALLRKVIWLNEPSNLEKILKIAFHSRLELSKTQCICLALMGYFSEFNQSSSLKFIIN